MSLDPGRWQRHGGLLRGRLWLGHWVPVESVLTGVAGFTACAALPDAVLGWMPPPVWMVEDPDA